MEGVKIILHVKEQFFTEYMRKDQLSMIENVKNFVQKIQIVIVKKGIYVKRVILPESTLQVLEETG